MPQATTYGCNCIAAPPGEHDRNANHTKANWQFSTPNARIKLKHLYPAI